MKRKNVDNRADYAEMFEAIPEFASAKIPRGTSVVFEGDKIRPAKKSEEPFGVITSFPIMLGNNAKSTEWTGKYLKDDFGNFLTEEVEIWTFDKSKYISERSKQLSQERNEELAKKNPSEKKLKRIDDDFKALNIEAKGVKGKVMGYVRDGNMPEGALTRMKVVPVLNPEYNPAEEYTSRAHRPEWNAVGLLGKVKILKGQPTDKRWIKLSDISDTVEEWLIR